MHFRELTDRYSLDKILRSTRTGTVLRATDSRSGQAVAVKLINVASPADLVQRAPAFEKLTAALEALRHPNLPLILDSGFTTEGSAFLVMEMLEGTTLDTASGPPLRLLTLLFQALNGLEAMARRGIAHGNVTPDNLLLVNGGQERIKILGLGTGLFRAPATEASDWRADLHAFAQSCCQILGANIAPEEPPVVQLPFALSLELENSEALRQTLERALRPNPAERPSHQEIRDAFRLALGVSEVPVPAEEKPAPGPKLVVPAPAPPAPIQEPAPPSPVAAPRLVPPAPPAPMTGPAAAAAAAVPLPEPDDTGGDLLSFDDGLLAPLPPPVPAQPTVPGTPAAASSGTVIPFNRPGSPRPTPPPQGRGGVAAAVPPKPESPLRRPAVLLGIAAGLVLVLGIAYWWVSRGAVPEASPAVAAPAAAPPPPPRRQARDVLAEAQLAFADGDDSRALETLRSLTAADQSTLGPAGCRSLQSLQDTLMLSALAGLPDNLAKGLKGDVGRLRLAVMTGTGQEASLPEPLRPGFERARGLVDLYAQIGAAADRKAAAEVLDRFAVLNEQLPNATDPLGLRDQAADALEGEAEALARGGNYQEAVTHLGPVLRAWPGRPGLKAKIDGYQKAQHDEAQQEQVLAEIPALERRHQLDEAFGKLRGVTPTPHLAAQFAEARQRLEGQLAQVDGQPPQIELRDGFLLDYDRGRVVQLSFRVTDDYKVRDVKLMARPAGGPAGGKMRELPLQVSRLGYTAEIPPAFHQNGTVDFYVTATDVSGHTGSFGTPDRPQQLKRREGFQRILR